MRALQNDGADPGRSCKRTTKDKAAIVVIDVCKNRDQVQRFGIRAIPTQIFFDANGRKFTGMSVS
ncbi:MAG: thioredoxin family protein [Desulfobacterales bacterium]|nr:thioredoxin family protein [Desulfobacterales bacterium]